MLRKLANLLQNFPMKSVLITIVVVAVLVSGVRNMFMATGNDTFVKRSSDVFQKNEILEEEFGGESIIVLYESDHLLTPEHLEHMKKLENTLQTTPFIYSVLSPVTLVEEMTKKQSEMFFEGIEEMGNGIHKIGEKLIEMGTKINVNILNKEMTDFPQQAGLKFPEEKELELPIPPDIPLPTVEAYPLPDFGEITAPNIGEQMTELNKGLEQMITAQESLGQGTHQLVEGYVQFGTKTNVLADTLKNLAGQMQQTPEQALQLLELSGQLNHLSKQMIELSEGTAQLPNIPEQAIGGLENIQANIQQQLEEQKKLQIKQKRMQEQMKKKIEEKQSVLKVEMQQKMDEQVSKQKETFQEMQKQQANKKSKLKEDMLSQQKNFQKQIESQFAEQSVNLQQLPDGLQEMGENLQTMGENLQTIREYADILSPGIPKTEATLNKIVYDGQQIRPIFTEVLVDDSHLLMMIRLRGNTADEEKSEVIGLIHRFIDNNPLQSGEILVSGKPVLDYTIRSSMKINMQKMMGLALLIMVAVLLFVFKVQWRLMPLLTVLIAVVSTVGLMGWLQIPITMVSMAVFPILIGLGIDYAIQLQNRYTEEMSKENLNE